MPVIPVLTPQTIGQVRIGSSLHTDVTGGMEGKIRELLALAREGRVPRSSMSHRPGLSWTGGLTGEPW